MIIIIDTYAGLCNQMFDIISGIKLMKTYHVSVSFRSASFRRKNLSQFYPVPFSNLFSEEPFLDEEYYIPYSSIKQDIQKNNSFNWEGKRCIDLWEERPIDFFSELKKIPKKYILLKQLWPLRLFPFENKELLHYIKPNRTLFQYYEKIKNEIELPENYLFLHYRYEYDFTRYFRIKVLPLDEILKKIEKEEDSIYIASTNPEELVQKKKSYFFKKKNGNLNFEEAAMIDFLFGLSSKKIFGHSKSSFSRVLNDIKGTNNYYA